MSSLKLTAAVTLVAGMVSIACGQRAWAEELKTPTIEARLVIDGEGRIMVEVLTKEKLVKPQLQHYVGQWQTFEEPKQVNGKFLYRAKGYYTLSENVVLSLKSAAVKEKSEFVTSLVVPPFAADAKQPVALRVDKTEVREQGKEPAHAAGHDIGLAIINRFRALRGLAPIQYDQGYADVSRINNERGGGHRYNTGWQTWASPSDPESAVSMWMGAYYKSHGVIIMNPNITRGGTHSHPSSGTTFTGG